jgi:phosphoribosylamine--glycine ligase
MRVLVVGGGGREHALCWGLARSPGVEQLHAAPGNPGIARLATCHAVAADDVAGQAALANALDPDLVVVGPEAPLVAGLGDELRASGRSVFGPGRAGARLEGSKAFAKGFMDRHGIPTARAGAFVDVEAAVAFVDGLDRPAVVKADGLAAGKGVTVAADRAEAVAAIEAALAGGAFGAAGERVVVEERLEGPEVSAFALVDASGVVQLGLAQDFKRVGDGDTGPNTGGMGAYSPLPWLGADTEQRIWDVVADAVRGLRADGIEYRGVLYTGLMLTADGPKVLEYNCRFGDPETQVQMLRMEDDLADVCLKAARGNLGDTKLNWKKEAAACVFIAVDGYPDEFVKGQEVDFDPVDDESVVVFHAGVVKKGGKLVNQAGRVVSVCARAGTLSEALAKAYQAAPKVRFEGARYRRDIGYRALASVQVPRESGISFRSV